jgi:hypothetical protein
MSEPIKWKQLSDKDKGKLVLEHVLGYFILPDGSHKDGDLIKRGLGAPAGYHDPVAFWDEWLGCYQIRDVATDPSPFDPLHSLDDAWVIVKEMNKPIDGPLTRYDRYGAFIDALEKIVGSTMFFDLFYCDPNSDDQHLTPERICLAALIACGIEVEL